MRFIPLSNLILFKLLYLFSNINAAFNAFRRLWLEELSGVELSNSSKVETVDSETNDSIPLADESRAFSIERVSNVMVSFSGVLSCRCPVSSESGVFSQSCKSLIEHLDITCCKKRCSGDVGNSAWRFMNFSTAILSSNSRTSPKSTAFGILKSTSSVPFLFWTRSMHVSVRDRTVDSAWLSSIAGKHLLFIQHFRPAALVVWFHESLNNRIASATWGSCPSLKP